MRRSNVPKPNINEEERRVMDKKDYKQKAEELLDQQQTYRIIPADTTNRHKNRFISLLKNIKAEGGIQAHTYKMLYPTEASSPKFYGLPKIHETGVPLRSIVSSRGTVTHRTAKNLPGF